MEVTTETSRAENESEKHLVNNSSTLQLTKSFFSVEICSSLGSG